MSSLTILVPVFNETAALSLSRDYFAHLGVRPLYVLDGKRQERKRALEKMLKQEVPLYENPTGFAEGNFEALAALSPTDWILRIDCDEVPTKTLIEHAQRFVGHATSSTCAYDRDDLIWRGDHFDKRKYAPLFFDSQHRLFNRTQVTFTHRLHTPGYHIAKWKLPYVPLWHGPPKARLYHLQRDFIDKAQFADKVKRYTTAGQARDERGWWEKSSAEWAWHHDTEFAEFYADWLSRR